MRSSSWFVFFIALFLETLHQNQLFEGTPLGLQSLSKILKHLFCVSPSPMLIWALQRSRYFKIRVAQHWGGRGHITVRTTISTICDKYCYVALSIYLRFMPTITL